jgi:dienelactone hydrolase
MHYYREGQLAVKTPWLLFVGAVMTASLAASGHAADSVPPILTGGFPSFETPRPASANDWEQQRAGLRKKLWRLLGELPPLGTPKVAIQKTEQCDGYTREHLTFQNGIGDTVYGYLLVPAGARGRGPAILYHHYHGGQYAQGKEELFRHAFAPMGNENLVTGPELVRAGYVVFCIDAYCFGERRWQGPAGKREEGGQTESALSKTLLWEGRTLWGMIVRDDQMALGYLAARPEVDPARIAAMGLSMGSTRTWWLAALDERIKVAVSVSCLTRYQDLIRDGEVNGHGIYYFVPGLLHEKIDMESIVGLIAPRAHLTLTGDRDAGSPASGVRTINGFQEHLYRLYGKEENFRGILYPGVHHEYTPAMWDETLRWLKKHL